MKTPQDLLKLLDDYEIDIFTVDSFLEATNESLGQWMSQLRTLLKNGLINILEKGKYCRHNFRDEYVIGNYLIEDGIIGYWSALNIHGLTEQISNTVFVQTENQKKDKRVFGVFYHFIHLKSSKIGGVEIMGEGNHSYRVTDREKTIVDCFDLPQYGGEFPGIIRAFVNNQWDEKKIIKYAEQVGNQAAVKRMAYCAELFELPMNDFIEFAKNKVTNTISLFDKNHGSKGKIISRWGLKLNVEMNDLLAFKYY